MHLPDGPFAGHVDYDAVSDRARTIDLGTDPAAMREQFARLLLGDDPAPDPRPALTLGGVEARLSGDYASLDDYAGRVVAWFHGGGYVFGSPETHLRPTTLFAEAMACPVLAVRYRLAPEHTWPAQLDDGLAAAKALQDRGHAVILAGDSAGGHLAVNVALRLAAAGRPASALALFSPNTDRTGLNATRAHRSEMDPIVDDGFDAKLAGMCFAPAGLPPDAPEVSPLYGDLGALPRTHIEVGGRELLRDDSALLYAFAKKAGAEVTLRETPGAFHMWQVWAPWLTEGAESLWCAAGELTGVGE